MSRRSIPSPSNVNLWLSRPISLPLSISLDCYSPSYYSGFEPYLDNVILVKSRWRTLHVSNPLPDVLKYVFPDGVRSDFLEELLVDSTSFPIFGEEESIPPKLHSLSLPFHALMGLRLKTNFGKLTRLGITGPKYDIRTIGSYELSKIILILESVPLLQNLAISGFHTSFPLGTSPFLQRTIYLPYLDTLSITHYQPNAFVWEFLQALHTPLLRHWKYYLLANASLINEHLDALSVLLRRLKDPLEELDLYLHSYGTEFRRILGMLPGLKGLSLQKPLASGPWFPMTKKITDIGDFHLKCLVEDSQFNEDGESVHMFRIDDSENNDPVAPTTPLTSNGPTSGFYCPQLEVIKCVCRVGLLSENSLLDFLRVRTGVGAKASGIAPLKKVVFLIETPVSEGLKERVHQLLDGTGTLFHLLSAPPSGRCHHF